MKKFHAMVDWIHSKDSEGKLKGISNSWHVNPMPLKENQVSLSKLTEWITILLKNFNMHYSSHKLWNNPKAMVNCIWLSRDPLPSVSAILWPLQLSLYFYKVITEYPSLQIPQITRFGMKDTRFRGRRGGTRRRRARRRRAGGRRRFFRGSGCCSRWQRGRTRQSRDGRTKPRCRAPQAIRRARSQSEGRWESQRRIESWHSHEANSLSRSSMHQNASYAHTSLSFQLLLLFTPCNISYTKQQEKKKEEEER